MKLCGDRTFSILVGVFQVCLLVVFALTVKYKENKPINPDKEEVVFYYSFFQDIHVMIFVGFGFLMTFLKKYGFGAVGYTMFISVLVLQWATLVNGFMANAFSHAENPGEIRVDLKTFITNDFAAATVLISFGALLGKVSRLQLFVISIFEVIFYALNENILSHQLQVTDVGGSMVIHMFGAYFGLAVARVLFKNEHENNDKEGSNSQSDLFAMIGTLFLWMFWPSFNAGLLGPGPQQNRAIVNTYYSLAASCLITFTVSPLINKEQKLNMVHIQNATLAGGVAVGASADLILQPWGAILIGMIAGTISTVGFAYVTPFLTSKLRVHDTCGVNNLHGMPALFAAIAAAVASACANYNTYKDELFAIWPARKHSTAPTNSTVSGLTDGRSAAEQGGMQAAALFVTLLIAIIGGLLTGFIVQFLDTPYSEECFDDAKFWVSEEDAENSNETSGLLKQRKNGIEDSV